MDQLIVSNIEQIVATDGNPLWVISFRDKKLTLTERQQPTFKVGGPLPFRVKVVKPPEGEKGNWYYKRLEATTPTPKDTGSKYAKNDDAIMLQVAFKGAIEAEGYWYIPDGKAHTNRILENTLELFNGLQEILKGRKQDGI